MYQKYIYFRIKNYLRNTGHTVSDSILSYLKGRPKSVILHCLQRKLKCHKLSVEDMIMLGGGNFQAHKAGTEKKYAVSFEKPECTCKDWQGIRYLANISLLYFSIFLNGTG